MCCTGCTPEPVNAILAGEFVALLETLTLPVALPALLGAKVTFNVAVCPAEIINPEDTPLTLKPGPDWLTLEIVTLELPVLVIVTESILLVLTFTLPKLRLDGLLLSRNVAAFTVNVATLLVALPTEFVTMTENCAPLSAAVVAGVV